MQSMLDRIVATAARHRMLPPGARVIAAVSGGPDSVCLLHVLRNLAPRLGFELAAVAHFNHKLRGADSDADERFVADMADALGIPFHSASAAPPKRGNLEQAARRARQRFFRALLRKLPADGVALGHTRDDQAETVLFRLLRGSGLAGLAGILPVTADGIVRPLLDVTRTEVLAYLGERGIGWREDATNRQLQFARNRVRHELLPQLSRDWNPQAPQVLAHLADLAYEEERWWAAQVAQRATNLLFATDGAVDLDAPGVAALPHAFARRLIRHALRLAKGNLAGVEFGHVERLLDLACGAAGGGRLTLPGLIAVRSFDWIRLAAASPAPPAPPQPVSTPGEFPAPDGNSLIVLEFVDGVQPPDGYATLGVDLKLRKLPVSLELRGWRPGDKYRPLGHAREQKVKDLFQRARIPSWRRASWPILCSEDKILWAREFGAAAEFAAKHGGGRQLRIREIPRPR